MLIGIDWGTTNARAFLIEGATVRETRRFRAPIRDQQGRFAEALQSQLGDWLKNCPAAPIIMCGMVGSREGWRDAGYADCLAMISDFGERLCRIERDDRPCVIAPGLKLLGADAADVMRGEETQIIGAAALAELRDATLVLPGTHSKWVALRSNAIARFSTYMTGELYELLSKNSILAHSVDPNGVNSNAAFLKGVEKARRSDALLSDMFRLRAMDILGVFDRADGASYLSGLLIGSEIEAAIAGCRDKRVMLVGDMDLCGRYQKALDCFGVDHETIDGEAAVLRGLTLIAEYL